MDNHLLFVCCLIFIAILLTIIILSICMYNIGYNNGFDKGYQENKRSRFSNRCMTADTVKVLQSNSERPVYVDGRSKYHLNNYSRTKQ